MSTRHQSNLRNLLAGCLILASYFGGLVPVEAQVAEDSKVTTHHAPGQGVTSEFIDPVGTSWSHIDEHTIDLRLAPPVHRSVALRTAGNESASVPLMYQVVRASGHLWIRLRWSDPSESTTNAFDKFADAAAVQFPLSDGEDTFFMMGTPKLPVNIWYWRGSEDAPQELIAGGFGSTTRADDPRLSAKSVYVEQGEGEWVVVFSRPLTSESQYKASFDSEAVVLGFAVWRGDEGQRDGFKYVTDSWVRVEPVSIDG